MYKIETIDAVAAQPAQQENNIINANSSQETERLPRNLASSYVKLYKKNCEEWANFVQQKINENKLPLRVQLGFNADDIHKLSNKLSEWFVEFRSIIYENDSDFLHKLNLEKLIPIYWFQWKPKSFNLKVIENYSVLSFETTLQDNGFLVQLERVVESIFPQNEASKVFSNIKSNISKGLGDVELIYKIQKKLNSKTSERLKNEKIIAEEARRKENEEKREQLEQEATLINAPKTNEKFYLVEKKHDIMLYDYENITTVGYISFSGGEIRTLRVADHYQGKGLGDVLLEAALKKGCYCLLANGRRAFKLYKKYGFVAIGVYNEEIKTKKELSSLYEYGTFGVAKMCLKSHLSKFGLKWNDFQQKVDEVITQKYRGMIDSMKKYEIGDKLNLKNGQTATIVDCVDGYYLLEDYNGKQYKIKATDDKKILVKNQHNKKETKNISLSEIEKCLVESLPEDIAGRNNDADYFFISKSACYPLVLEAIDNNKFKKLLKELEEEELPEEPTVAYLYEKDIVDEKELLKIIDINKLAKLMIDKKIAWVFPIDTYNDFYIDLSEIQA